MTSRLIKSAKWLREEAGQVLVVVLVLLAVGSLILVPLLSYMDTGLKSGTVYENKTTDYYSADAGVEDALWQIKYGHLDDTELFSTPYNVYGFDVMGIDFDYKTPLSVNDGDVNVNIANVWIPKDLNPGTDPNVLKGIIENAKLVVAGSASGVTQYKIVISYDKASEDGALLVTAIGVWLPPGFGYVSGSCALDDPSTPLAPYHTDDVEISDWAGGKVVIWKYASPINFSTAFVGLPSGKGDWQVSGNHMKVDLFFDFTAPQPGSLPDAVAWIQTSGVNDIPFAWDADVRVFKITSMAPRGTEIDAYGIKIEQRQLAKAIPGDYQAIGNSLMTDDNPDSGHIRDTFHEPTPANPSIGSSTASDIPGNAEVAEAYLYWSGWYNDSPSSPTPTTVFSDSCSSITTYWTTLASAWEVYSSTFRGHYTTGGEDARYITLSSGIDMSAFAGKSVTLSFQYGESGTLEAADMLQYQISWDGGTSWNSLQTVFADDRASNYPTLYNYDNNTAGYAITVPASAPQNLKIRFYLASFADGSGSSTEYCYIDNIAVKVQVFNDSCSDLSATGNWTQTGSAWSLTSSGNNPWPAFQGHSTASSQTDPVRYLTLKSTVLNLGSYSAATVSLDAWISGSPGSSDRLYISFWNGSAWVDSNGITGQETQIFSGNIGTSPVTYSSITIPSSALRNNFQMRLRVYGFNDTTAPFNNCYVDNIKINVAMFSDDCSTFTNWTLTNSAWSSDTIRFVGQYTGTNDVARYLTLTNAIDLHNYTADVVSVSWDQWAAGSLDSGDMLQYQLSDDGGATWSSLYTAAQDDVQSGGFSTSSKNFGINLASQYLTSGFKIRFYLTGFGVSKTCYVDNIRIDVWVVSLYDSCSFLDGWSHDADWGNYYNSQFVGQHTTGNGYLTMNSSINLTAFTGQSANVAWEQSESGTLSSSDSLQFEFSGDGGAHWSAPFTAFADDIGSTPQDFTHTIPSQYLTSDFKMRLLINGFGSGKYCYVDNIIIYGSGLWADPNASFYIDGQQVSFDANGVPQRGVAQDLTADRTQVINGLDHVDTSGYYYSSFVDVTALVRAFAQKGTAGNCPGNGTYAVGNVGADTGNQQSYAGWSLLIIYTSPETQGHQLYLYDTFLFAGHYENVDFDQDGNPGGTIGGFLVPEPITGEVYAAKISCFVGEGDDWITGQSSPYHYGEYVALNGTRLWDGIDTTDNSAANPDNPWNDQSVGMSADGVDVDTFYIRWDSGILNSGDTSASLDLQTDWDVWGLVYVILSFRSQTTTGGTVTYLIKTF